MRVRRKKEEGQMLEASEKAQEKKKGLEHGGENRP